MYRSISIYVLLLVCLAGVARAAEEPAGLVIAVTPGAFVERASGSKEALRVKSPIFVSDTVVTDATGKVQILFDDDTNVAVGADTRVSLREFADERSAEPVFKAGVESGIVRFVTGKIVEKNRSGFHIQTPQATIGIRGTTFSVQVSGGTDGKTMVIGHHVTDGFPISVTNAATGATARIDASGRAVEATPAGNTEQAAPAGHLSQSGARVRQPVAAAAGQPSQQPAAPAETSAVSAGLTEALGDMQVLGQETSSAASASEGGLSGFPAIGSISQIDSDMSGVDTMTPTTLPSSVTDMQQTTGPVSGSGLSARYAGGLTHLGNTVGTFTLDANVASGQVSNAAMHVTGGSLVNFTAEGGSGTIAGNKKFSITNFTITNASSAVFKAAGSAWMDGKFNGPDNSKVKGDWGSNLGPTPIHNGSFEGTTVP